MSGISLDFIYDHQFTTLECYQPVLAARLQFDASKYALFRYFHAPSNRQEEKYH